MLIAIYSYYSQAGKDTCADSIQEYALANGWSVSRVSFGDAMKQVCANALGVQGDLQKQFIDTLKLDGKIRWIVESDDRCTGQISGRDFIIGLAEGIRALDAYFWIRHTIPSAGLVHSPMHLHLIPDLRFEAEAIAVHRAGGYIIHLDRSTGDGIHINEDNLPDSVDAAQYIDNNSTLDHLKMKSIHAFERIVDQAREERADGT